MITQRIIVVFWAMVMILFDCKNVLVRYQFQAYHNTPYLNHWLNFWNWARRATYFFIQVLGLREIWSSGPVLVLGTFLKPSLYLTHPFLTPTYYLATYHQVITLYLICYFFVIPSVIMIVDESRFVLFSILRYMFYRLFF